MRVIKFGKVKEAFENLKRFRKQEALERRYKGGVQHCLNLVANRMQEGVNAGMASTGAILLDLCSESHAGVGVPRNLDIDNHCFVTLNKNEIRFNEGGSVRNLRLNHDLQRFPLIDLH